MAKRRRLNKIRVSVENPSTSTEMAETQHTDMDASHTVQKTMSREETTIENEMDPSMQDDQDSEENSVTRRGPTILADIWNQSPEEKWVVKFNRYGQPIGEESTLLSSFIGTIGRNPELAPQGHPDWRLVPKEYKDKCMDEIRARFTFPRIGEPFILKTIGERVKDFRGELKAEYYEPNKHNRNLLVENKPGRVPIEQWLKLITYWEQDKTKRRATMNKNNQLKQKMPHCSGRKSFARRRAEKTINGVEPS
ncbi:uncharacterized protein LOC110711233 [Chenopodium quinoa]|uniref:uncharacterized protein LOC110711233 n=1 Tax=Chenopodium quinoa TaxID=63459 RepID=UPI000B780123|nr:uncharacterized protein LOC110711233 [Chenopodium quinoa]XP_021745302.1 uncharacterized protein LOC110711233 [Chenopodium quinoa]